MHSSFIIQHRRRNDSFDGGIWRSTSEQTQTIITQTSAHEEALAESKRVCRILGLLRKKHLVKSLTEPLPLANVQRTFNEKDNENDIFITPRKPSYVPQHYPEQYCPLSPLMISSVADVPLPGDDNDDQQTADMISGTPLRASVTTARFQKV